MCCTIICGKGKSLFYIFMLLLPVRAIAETKTWTGYGGDANWSNSLNWSGQQLPGNADEVVLDNRDMPLSYQVILPDTAVKLSAIRITPSPGRNIELILPVTNLITDAFSVTGPGYGIELNAGAIFRNASGLSSGESLQIADSMIIRDGARYIHQTRAAHANSILKILSTAPGTEEGVFDFDVPRAAYTISVSNRIYGSLELHAAAYGSTVSYTCSGANPLLVRGNLRMGSNVHLTMNLSGSNGNMQVQGDFIQEGGLLNLSSSGTNNPVFRIEGDLYQSPGASITESASGNPFIELAGKRQQEIAMAGQILNQVGLRMNNPFGAKLRLPLKIPWKLDLLNGVLFSSANEMLILDTFSGIVIDSSRLTGSFVDGPLCKQGMNLEDHFIFPVGKSGNLHWLELKNASGDYTVEYLRQNPAVFGLNLAAGLDHISKLEYWTVTAAGKINDQAKIELSYASALSGGVTDPQYLNVAMFRSSLWENAGHTAITGNSIQGSVLSGPTNFSANAYTLASTINLENPLPLTLLEMKVKEISGIPVFSWTVLTEEEPVYFDLLEETENLSVPISRIPAGHMQRNYDWACNNYFTGGLHFFRIRMIDRNGKEYEGNRVSFKIKNENTRISWQSPVIPGKPGRLFILCPDAETWQYEMISVEGRRVKNGTLKLQKGNNYFSWNKNELSSGLYIFHGKDSSGNAYSVFCKME